MAVANVNQCIRICDAANALGDWLYNWQTLLAGLLALLGAMLTVRIVREQIDQADRHERERLERVFRARRSTLPLILSHTSRYSEEVIRSIATARSILAGAGKPRLTGKWSPPVFPDDVPSELSQFLEISDHTQANELISELLRQLQILRSRLHSLVAEEDVYTIGIPNNLAEYQLQAAKIRQLCNALFPFGRGEADGVPGELRRDEVVRSINFIDHQAEDDQAFAGRVETFLRANEIWWPNRQ